MVAFRCAAATGWKINSRKPESGFRCAYKGPGVKGRVWNPPLTANDLPNLYHYMDQSWEKRSHCNLFLSRLLLEFH